MPTFLRRRYARPLDQVSRTERLVGVGLLALLAAAVGALAGRVLSDRAPLFELSPEAAEPDAGGSAAPAAVLAELALPGWTGPAQLRRFAPDELYLKIDGRAELYLQHDVAGLTFAAYRRADDPQRGLDVYCYEMRDAACAGRIYDLERPPDAAALALGDAAYQAGGAVYFRRGSAYVQVLPAAAEDADAALELARRLAEADGAPGR